MPHFFLSPLLSNLILISVHSAWDTGEQFLADTKAFCCLDSKHLGEKLPKSTVLALGVPRGLLSAPCGPVHCPLVALGT